LQRPGVDEGCSVTRRPAPQERNVRSGGHPGHAHGDDRSGRDLAAGALSRASSSRRPTGPWTGTVRTFSMCGTRDRREGARRTGTRTTVTRWRPMDADATMNFTASGQRRTVTTDPIRPSQTRSLQQRGFLLARCRSAGPDHGRRSDRASSRSIGKVRADRPRVNSRQEAYIHEGPAQITDRESSITVIPFARGFAVLRRTPGRDQECWQQGR
jgi:hypothetical protein